jgi:hypothetical protein
VHEALIHKIYAGEIVGHISRASTAIESREKPVKKVAKTAEEHAPQKLPEQDIIQGAGLILVNTRKVGA